MSSATWSIVALSIMALAILAFARWQRFQGVAPDYGWVSERWLAEHRANASRDRLR